MIDSLLGPTSTSSMEEAGSTDAGIDPSITGAEATGKSSVAAALLSGRGSPLSITD